MRLCKTSRPRAVDYATTLTPTADESGQQHRLQPSEDVTADQPITTGTADLLKHLGVQALFVGNVRSGFELKRRVLNGEVFGETRLQRVENSRHVTAIKAAVLHHHVRREGREIGRHRPRVKIVNVEDVFDLDQVSSDVAQTQVVRGSLKEDSPGVTQEAPRRAGHERDDEE
jgi:hypothetical protein